jgi:uncharacterized surface protein with fasciclin (FAS1) repeats
MTLKCLILSTAALSVSGLSYVAIAGDCGSKAASACGVQTVATESPVAKSEPKAGKCEATPVTTEAKEGGSCSSTVSADGKKTDSCCGPKDLTTVIAKHDKLTTLAGLLKSSGLDKDLAGEKKLTIFAPTDDAFAKLPEATLEALAKPENKDQLKAILTSHVIDGASTSCCLTDGQTVKSLSGQVLTVSVKDGKVNVNGANVVTANVEAVNGVVHAIDTVILPVKG